MPKAFSDEVDTGSSQKMRPNKKPKRRSFDSGRALHNNETSHDTHAQSPPKRSPDAVVNTSLVRGTAVWCRQHSALDAGHLAAGVAPPTSNYVT